MPFATPPFGQRHGWRRSRWQFPGPAGGSGDGLPRRRRQVAQGLADGQGNGVGGLARRQPRHRQPAGMAFVQDQGRLAVGVEQHQVGRPMAGGLAGVPLRRPDVQALAVRDAADRPFPGAPPSPRLAPGPVMPSGVRLAGLRRQCSGRRSRRRPPAPRLPQPAVRRPAPGTSRLSGAPAPAPAKRRPVPVWRRATGGPGPAGRRRVPDNRVAGSCRCAALPEQWLLARDPKLPRFGGRNGLGLVVGPVHPAPKGKLSVATSHGSASARKCCPSFVNLGNPETPDWWYAGLCPCRSRFPRKRE